MANELFDNRYRSTVPDDLNDPPRFAQILETTKDAFVLSLREFFNGDQVPGRCQELPTIEKYAAGFAASDDPFLTTVEIVQEYPDILEALPHVSVTAASAQNRRMTIGSTLVAQVQYPPRVEGTATPTFDLSTTDGSPRMLRLRTQPNRSGIWEESCISFRQSRFVDWTAATLAEVLRVFQERPDFIQAFETTEGTLGIQCGGARGGDRRPNAIEILGTSDPDLLTALGFTVGQSDNSLNQSRAPQNRYHMSSAVTINVDVLSVDPNTRREVADLIYSWATFWMERNNFELQGRTWQDEAVSSPEEWYHISFHQEVNLGAHQETARLNDAKDKIHIQRITIPVTTWMYIDRAVRKPDGSNWILQSEDFTLDTGIPDGCADDD